MAGSRGIASNFMKAKYVPSIYRILIAIVVFLVIMLIYQFVNIEKYYTTEMASHVRQEDVVGDWRIIRLPSNSPAHFGWKKMRLRLERDGEFSLTNITQDIRNNAFLAPLNSEIKAISGTWELHNFKQTVNMEKVDRSTIVLKSSCEDSQCVLYLLIDSHQNYRISWRDYNDLIDPSVLGTIWIKTSTE
ncbi:MAG: hypothetical protein FWC50_06835 [Planctomycetaceae bacterium]|nr:hypothetical protein [Planctomycetaceae bacterium]